MDKIGQKIPMQSDFISMESTWKTAVAVNFHQLYPYNQPNRALKNGTFLCFPGIYIYILDYV